MKHGTRFLAALVVVLFAVAGAGFSDNADAKRLGGGKNSGITRSDSLVQRDAASIAPARSTAAPVPTPSVPASQPARSGMWGMLGGLALGVGIGALLSQFGIGAEFGGMLMVMVLGIGAVLLFKMVFRRPAMARYAGTGAPVDVGPQLSAPGGPSVAAAPALPAGFDVDGFLRQARLGFVRLQAANDSGNLDDIRRFTSPEMYAEILLEYQERGKAAQRTDVVQLDAKLMDLSEEASRHIASVRFSGLLREAENEGPQAIDEVWHLTKSRDGAGGWILAGIQQVA